MRNGPAQVVEQAGREDHQSRPPSVAVIVGASIDWGLVCWAGRGAMLSARPETQPNSCEHTSYQLTVVPVAVVRAQPPVCSRGRRAARRSAGCSTASSCAARPRLGTGRGSAPNDRDSGGAALQPTARSAGHDAPADGVVEPSATGDVGPCRGPRLVGGDGSTPGTRR